MPVANPRAISAVVVTWNSAETILDCLHSLPEGLDVTVVDNGSTDSTIALLKASQLDIRILEPGRNLGFGAACNIAANQSRGDYLLLLNPDAVLEPNALSYLLQALERQSGVGVAAPKIKAPDGTIELSWGEEPGILQEWLRQRAQTGSAPPPSPPAALSKVGWASGACLLLRWEAWQSVGGFDEGFFLYFEDLDLCRRIRQAGWSIVYEPLAGVMHGRGHSSSQIHQQVERWYRESQLRYYRKHRGRIEREILRGYLTLKYLMRLRREPSFARAILGSVWSSRRSS